MQRGTSGNQSKGTQGGRSRWRLVRGRRLASVAVVYCLNGGWDKRYIT